MSEDIRDKWQEALPTEQIFWEKVSDGTLSEYHQNLLERAAGKIPFPRHLYEFCRSDGATRILDVGAGPHTVIGLSNPPGAIEIVAVDPLADEYADMLRKFSIKPAVVTVKGDAERLSKYGFGKFDLVYSRNALDHAYDPAAAIKEMTSVVLHTGAIYIEGSVNEGEQQKYQGLHQWNFLPELDEDLTIWRPGTSFSVRELLGSQFDVKARGYSGTWYSVIIRWK